MAKIKPIIIGFGSKLNAIGTACDVIGMTEIPIVDQAACVVGAIAYTAAGQRVDAALSLGSLVPGVGKLADGLKLVKKSEKVVDGVSTAQKEAKLLTLTTKTTKKADDVEDVAKQAKPQPQPSKTQAKSPEKQPEKQLEQQPEQENKVHHIDSNQWFGMSGSESFPTKNGQGINFENYLYPTNSNPALNNPFRNTGSPLWNNVSTSSNLWPKL